MNAKSLKTLRSRVREDQRQALRAACDLADQPGSEVEFERALSRFELHEHRLSILPKVEVVKEPDLYERGSSRSFFRDMAVAAGASIGNMRQEDAAERLRQHSKYEADRVELAYGLALRGLDGHGIQTRDGSGATVHARALSSATGAGGELVPPKWMTELWANTSFAASPLRNVVTRVDLPDGTLQLVIPRFDANSGVRRNLAGQENVVPGAGPDAPTDDLVAKVVTFEGDTILSQALYERGGRFSDEIMANAFAEAYAEQLQAAMMVGAGPSDNDFLGLLNVSTSTVNGVPGAILQTYTSATPTPTALVTAIAQCAARVSDTRKRPPSIALTRGSRWFWIAGSPDGSGNEPAVRPGTGMVASEETGPFGPIAGLPVYHDNTIPTNLGAGTNQDAVVVVRTRDLLLLEDPVGPRFLAYPAGGLAGQLSVAVTWHTYAAFFPDRHPSAIGSVQGTGLALTGW